MKFCGFSFVKNAVKYDYPVVEAITSILPVYNKFIFAVGDCDDGTRALINRLIPTKLKSLILFGIRHYANEAGYPHLKSIKLLMPVPTNTIGVSIFRVMRW